MARDIRTCSSCQAEKPDHEFYSRQGRTGPRLTQPCKDCVRQRSRDAYEAADPVEYAAKRADRMLRSRYGITAAERDAMFAAQGGACAICGEHPKEGKRGLCVDHDHETGQVRAGLCIRCNVGVGVLESSLFDRFREYIDHHSSVQAV